MGKGEEMPQNSIFFLIVSLERMGQKGLDKCFKQLEKEKGALKTEEQT